MTSHWFISTRYRARSMLSLMTVLLAGVVILLGAYTRLTDAGLSCPDWPHCFGLITAPTSASQIESATKAFPNTPLDIKKAWTEMAHRYLAGTEGILVIILASTLLLNRKIRDYRASIIAVGLLALIAMQVILGMLTVTALLKPVIVTLHLVTGLTLLALLWWSYLDLHLRDDFFIPKTNQPRIAWLWITLLIVAAQIALGGWVSSHYAGLACTDFPLCNGEWLPTLQWQKLDSDLITIHMLHRIGALATTITLCITSIYLLCFRGYRLIASSLLVLLAVQISLGVLNLIWLRPIWLALMHHGIAMLLLMVLITALAKAHVQQRKRRYAFH